MTSRRTGIHLQYLANIRTGKHLTNQRTRVHTADQQEKRNISSGPIFKRQQKRLNNIKIFLDKSTVSFFRDLHRAQYILYSYVFFLSSKYYFSYSICKKSLNQENECILTYVRKSQLTYQIFKSQFSSKLSVCSEKKKNIERTENIPFYTTM